MNRSRHTICRLLFLAVAGVTLGQAAGAQEMGRQWKALSTDQTALRLALPSLLGTQKRFLWSQAPDFSDVLEVGIWTTRALRFPKVQIVEHELLSDYYFIHPLDLKAMVRRQDGFRSAELKFGKERTAQNLIGRIAYRTFSADTVQCVAFGQDHGKPTAYAVGVEGSGYSKRLTGYYCGNPGETLGEAAAKKVVQTIWLKPRK